MGLFGRIGNLARGLWITKTSTDGGDKATVDEAQLREELARLRVEAERAAGVAPADLELDMVEDDIPTDEEESPQGPARDDDGNIIKTL